MPRCGEHPWQGERCRGVSRYTVARDKKFRDELRRLVGNSKPKAKAVLLMDGSRTQKDIHNETSMHKGNLSTLVKQLGEGKLLSGDGKKPKLTITIPANFFEDGASDE